MRLHTRISKFGAQHSLLIKGAQERAIMDAQKEQAIKLLAHGMNAEAVAAKVGTTSRSLRRWKNDPEFAAELSDAFGDVKDNILFHVHPIIHNAQLHADEALIRNKELLRSDNSVVANRACTQASNSAIKWIKLFMALEHAANARQLAAAAREIARATVAQASNLHDAEAESCGTGSPAVGCPCASEGDNGQTAASESVTSEAKSAEADASTTRMPSRSASAHGQPIPITIGTRATPVETGQNRTPPESPIPAQPEAQPTVAPESATPPAVSAPDTKPDTVAQASSVQASETAPAGSRRDEKSAWKGKSPNHVPFYRKFQRR
jgi:hypothetical protein